LSGLTVNDTTNSHTVRIILGDDYKTAKNEFVYTDLSTIFPGYEFNQFGFPEDKYKEGAKIIFGAVVFSVVALLLTDYISINWLRIVFQLFILLFLVLILQFFRNPKRNTQLNEQQVISSVDGKVVCEAELTFIIGR